MMKFLLIFLIINLFQREFESKKIGDHRIIGGKKVKDIKRVPFVASLTYKDGKKFEFQCGGSIISEQWVLTAAHCIHNFDDYKFYVGYNSTKWAGGIQRYSVDKRHVHESYDFGSVDYDVALVHVSKRFPKKSIIRMVPSDFQYKPKSTLTVLGWGFTDNSRIFPRKHLSYVDIKLHGWNECERYYTKIGDEFTKRMFCAGAKGKGLCVYDSGGPIYQNYKKQKIQIGVVSWEANRCAHSKYSGVFSNLTVFTKWIKKRIGSGKRTTKKDTKYY